MKKRILSLALALCMMLSVMPTSYAGNGVLTLGDPDVQQENPVVDTPAVNEGPSLTLDGVGDYDNEPVKQPTEEPVYGVLTPDGFETNSREEEPEEPIYGVLTPDEPIEDETDSPADGKDNEPAPGALYFQCDFCGYLDGNHANHCPTQKSEDESENESEDEAEEEPEAVDISTIKASLMSAKTYQDIFDALMSSESLNEFESILDELAADKLEEFYDLLSDDEQESLDEQEDALARAVVTEYEKEKREKKTVTVERRASLFGAAQREALRQMGYELIVNLFGMIVDAIDLPHNDYTVMEAVSPEVSADYQWQILADDDLWVDIYNETDSLIRVSYAMVANLLDRYDTVQVRCEITSEDGISCTDPVEVTVDYTSEDVIIDAEEEPVEEDPVVEEPVAQTFSVTRLGGTYAQPFTVSLLEGEEDLKTYTVEIKYQFADGKQAANSWTGTFSAGLVEQTINSPTVIGYAPDQETVIINEELAADKTIVVTYKPALVEYKVLHYQQNVNDDDYTLVSEVKKEGYTESAVGEGLANTYAGFYALLYDETTEIAADGSTEVEIYYDRYYYLMNFGLDGGYGVEPIYARYGAPISAGTPTKEGFTFAGWKDDDTDTVYTVDAFPYKTMPAKNTTFIAQWTGTDVTFDVVYWYENADDEHFSQAGVQYDVAATSGTTVNGATYADYKFDGRDDEHFTYAFADENVIVSGDSSTVVNVYFRRNIYTLTYVMGSWADDCSVEEHRHVLDESSEDSCYGLNCQIEVHNHETEGCTLACSHATHDLSCYSSYYGLTETTEPTRNLTDQGNGIYTYTTRGTFGGTRTHYYLNLGAKWYCSNYSDQYEISLSCSHRHSAACYSCNKVNHSHSLDKGCYGLNCGKYEHYHSGNTCYLVVTAKYDADITSVWNNNPVKAVIDDGNAFRSSITGDYYSFLEKMPGQNITLTASDDSGNKYTWYYYLEVLPGQDTTGLTIRTDGGKTYYEYNSASRNASSLSLTYDEDYFPITGFTQRDSKVPSFSNRVAYLYYIRNTYTLAFSNAGSIVADKGGNFLYQADISNTGFTPAYPSGLEAGAYVFDGWYTSPYYGDTKFDFTWKDGDKTVKATMPAKDLTLYARWVPVNHTVSIYLTKAEDGTLGNKVGKTQVVAHRATATNPYADDATPVHPDSDKYVFVGWFYMDGETEKAFEFSMPVTKDLDLYAKWSSNTLMEYTIKYAVENKDGTLTYIAEDTIGSALAGTTKTFEAKSGEELFDLRSEGGENYQSGYFPTTHSHSLAIEVEGSNEYTFVYVAKEEVKYTVKYLEVGTEKVLIEQKSVTTRDAVVTETFVPYTGYMPDAYQKRLVLSADESLNVIIFWYSVDAVHAPVQIIHYIQNAEGDDYTEYQSTTDLNGVIDEQYNANVLTITGYDYDHATANGTAVTAAEGKVTGTVTESGLILKLYYNRELHPYEFQFLEQGTDKVLAASETGTARYGSQVIQNAKSIDGYKPNFDAQAITIQIEDGATADKNVRIFYYVEDEVTINYEAVGPDGAKNFGSVSRDDETLKVLTGTVQGSTATAEEHYEFVGWFDNEDCAGDAISVDAQYVPEKVDGKNVANTYYAKFVEIEVTIDYVAVGNGSVSPETETLGVVSGNAAGSTAAPAADHHFVGWYSDVACTNPISDQNAFVPDKVDGENVAATYYAKFEEDTVTITYVAVGPEGSENFGSVDPTAETLKVLTEDASGSTATAGENYHFVGWYTDEACTQVVNSSSVDANNKFVPAKVNEKNVAATYYAKFEEDEVTISYEVVGPTGCGTVDPTSETVKVLTGVASGSTAAAANNYYRFVGWYDNKDCTGTALSTDAKYTPAKVDGKNVAKTYYAKFEYNLTDLTISKTGWQEIDENQSFIFDVYHEDKLITTVVIRGTGTAVIKDLTVGETYRVVERETWSWRYQATDADQNIKLDPPGSANTVEFENSRIKQFWLNGCAAAKNIFKAVTKNAENN